MARTAQIDSPWSDRDRSAEREAKKEAVLRAAAQAFAENGYHRTSLDEIAARLGVTKPTLYYYARNKDDLIAAVAERGLQQILQAMDGDEQSSALDRLRHLLRRYAEVVTTDFGKCTVVMRDARVGDVAEQALRRTVARIDRRIRELLSLGIADGSIARCDVKIAAFTIAGALNGITRWYDPAGALGPSVVAEKMVNQLVGGLAPRV